MEEINTFATFGSGQLTDFSINPMSVILIAKDEMELRARLREHPFNNQYCTTYPISHANDMIANFGMEEITLSELLKLHKGK